ncbi:MAG: N-hydroxyarylamine O-acetyltransferase [Planctomycetota bacterium]|jgi:N-hydroxyarylamine O-acetyltransferase
MSIDPHKQHSLDVDAYFKRIGYDGSRETTIETLHQIVGFHTRAIPFENIDVLLERRIFMDPASIEKKLVGGGRGGYCFEQNTLLQHLLVALGFDVTPISARVRYQKPKGFIPPRSHLCLIVKIDDEDWLADVGIGGLSLTSAIRLILNDTQATPHDIRRLVSAGDWTGLGQRAPDAVIYHQVRLGDEWEDVAEFTLERMHAIDVEMANWYTNMHPRSHFRDRLTVARATVDGRLTLINREFKRRGPDGSTESRTLTDDAELLQVLAQEFGISLPPSTRFQEPSHGRNASLSIE